MALKTVSTTPYTMSATDDCIVFITNNNKVVFLADCTTLPPLQEVTLINQATPGTVTVVPSGSQTINGGGPIVLAITSSIIMVTDGANWFTSSYT